MFGADAVARKDDLEAEEHQMIPSWWDTEAQDTVHEGVRSAMVAVVAVEDRIPKIPIRTEDTDAYRVVVVAADGEDHRDEGASEDEGED